MKNCWPHHGFNRMETHGHPHRVSIILFPSVYSFQYEQNRQNSSSLYIYIYICILQDLIPTSSASEPPILTWNQNFFL